MKLTCSFCGRNKHTWEECRTRLQGRLPDQNRIKKEQSNLSGANSVPLSSSTSSIHAQQSSSPSTSYSQQSSSPSITSHSSPSPATHTSTVPSSSSHQQFDDSIYFLQPSTPKANTIRVMELLTDHNKHTQRLVGCLHDSEPDLILIALLDSGATHSCISPSTIKELGLTHLIKPPEGPITEVELADTKTTVQRIGTIILDLRNFLLGSDRATANLRMKLEIMNIDTDLLFGVDTLKILFPNDELTRFFISPSLLASIPIPIDPSCPPDSSIQPTPITLDYLQTLHSSHPSPRSYQQQREQMIASLSVLDEMAAEQICKLKKQEEAVKLPSEQDA